MNWSKLFIYGIMFFLLFAFKADQPKRIIWNSKRSLTWADYQGEPDFDDYFRDAVTASALVFKTKCDDETGLLKVVMEAQFIKDKSWVKPVARTPYHLKHEQLHFDIAELFARKFKQAIADRQLKCDDFYEVQALSHQFMDEAHVFQMKYDGSTKFSLDKVAQEQWQSSIQKQLADLNEFAN